MTKALVLLLGGTVAACVLFAAVVWLDHLIAPRIADWLLNLDSPEALTICGLTLDTRNAPASFDPERWRNIDCDALEERDLCILSCFTRGFAPGDEDGCHERCKSDSGKRPAS